MRWVPLKYLVQLNPEDLSEATPDGFEFNYIDIAAVDRDVGIKSATRFTFSDAPSRARRMVRRGDVIVSTVRTYLRAVAAVGGPHDGAVCSTGFAVLRPNDGFAETFLKYVVTDPSFVDEVVARSTGVSYPAINASELVRIPVPCPAPRAQNRIADFLDRECARIDSVSAEGQRLLAVLAEAEQSHLDEIVPWSAPQPRLGWLADVRTGVTIGQRYPAGTPLVSRPYLRVANVQADHLDLTEIKTVDVPANDAASTTLEDGDVLMTEGGDIDKLGRGTVWRGEIPDCLHQNHVFAVRPYDDRLCSQYLAAITRTSHARRYFESTATRSTNLASTNSTKVRSFRFPVPSRATQLEIVRTMERHLTSTTALRSDLKRLHRGLSEYRDALITEAVTGKLDVAKLSESQMDESLAAVREGERPEVLSS